MPNGANGGGPGKLQKTIDTVLELYAGDEEDLALISVYSGAMAYLNAASRPDKGDVCSLEETIAGFSFWALAVTIYCLRHFVIYRERYRHKFARWVRAMRCVIFCVILLVINQQPLTCLASEDKVKTVRYVQAAAWTGLAMCTSGLLAEHIFLRRKSESSHTTQPAVEPHR